MLLIGKYWGRLKPIGGLSIFKNGRRSFEDDERSRHTSTGIAHAKSPIYETIHEECWQIIHIFTTTAVI